MIIRKPYAFLIKNFRKIHIFLLLLSLYVAYKIFDVSTFVNEFMSLGTYDLFQDPITNHITALLSISLILLVIGSGALLLLLRHKKKPFKIYLVPIIEYIVLFFVLSMIKSFFKGYSSDVATTDLRMSRDLLLIFMIAQIPAIAIYMMRVFGLDFKKFEFNSDKEFLELSEADREEVEIGFSIDKYSFIRGYKRLFRNLKYFYLEHKKICHGILAIFIFIVGFKTYQLFFVTHKSYSEGDFYSVNGYTFKINKTYYTDKDFHGDIITDKSNFVIIDLTITNNSGPRTIYLENFHIKNGTEDFITTNKTYGKEFQDLGTTYESVKELKRDESFDCIIIYKVDKNLSKNRFVLYYQESNGYLRKIKLNIKDIRKIEDAKELSLGDEIDLGFRNNSDVITLEDYEVVDSISYTTRKCTTNGCNFSRNNLSASDYRILKLDFSTNTYEAKNLVDFLNNYGKLIYKDSNDVEDTLEILNPISKTYYGKSVFLKVPVEVENAKELRLELIVRDKYYIYKLI